MWMTGQVVDDHGHALSGVIVEACGLGAIGRRAAISNAQGQHVMQDLPPGAYTIMFTRSGFTTLKRQIDRQFRCHDQRVPSDFGGRAFV